MLQPNGGISTMGERRSSTDVLILSVLEVNSFYTVADRGKDLVWNGIKYIAEHSDRQVVTENLDTVAFFTVDACDVDHGHIHADVADIRCLLSVHQAIAVPVAEMAVQAVCIADWYGGNQAVMLDSPLARIAYSVTGRHMAQLENGRLQGRDVVDDLVRTGIDAVESQSQPAHVHLSFREMFDTCRVVHVADDFMLES